MIILQILYLLIGTCLSVAFVVRFAGMIEDAVDSFLYVASICFIFLFWPLALFMLYLLKRA